MRLHLPVDSNEWPCALNSGALLTELAGQTSKFLRNQVIFTLLASLTCVRQFHLHLILSLTLWLCQTCLLRSSRPSIHCQESENGNEGASNWLYSKIRKYTQNDHKEIWPRICNLMRLEFHFQLKSAAKFTAAFSVRNNWAWPVMFCQSLITEMQDYEIASISIQNSRQNLP